MHLGERTNYTEKTWTQLRVCAAKCPKMLDRRKRKKILFSLLLSALDTLGFAINNSKPNRFQKKSHFKASWHPSEMQNLQDAFVSCYSAHPNCCCTPSGHRHQKCGPARYRQTGSRPPFLSKSFFALHLLPEITRLVYPHTVVQTVLLGLATWAPGNLGTLMNTQDN